LSLLIPMVICKYYCNDVRMNWIESVSAPLWTMKCHQLCKTTTWSLILIEKIVVVPDPSQEEYRSRCTPRSRAGWISRDYLFIYLFNLFVYLSYLFVCLFIISFRSSSRIFIDYYLFKVESIVAYLF